jgi:hypothetical protein
MLTKNKGGEHVTNEGMSPIEIRRQISDPNDHPGFWSLFERAGRDSSRHARSQPPKVTKPVEQLSAYSLYSLLYLRQRNDQAADIGGSRVFDQYPQGCDARIELYILTEGHARLQDGRVLLL